MEVFFRESLAVGIELALFIVVVPEQLRGLGNIVQCDEEYSRVIRVLIYGEGLNIGVVERMIHGCTPCQGASRVAFIWINSARKWNCLFRGGIFKRHCGSHFGVLQKEMVVATH